MPPRDDVAVQFLLARRQPTRSLDDDEAAILKRLARGPASLSSLVQESRYGALVLRRIERLVAERLVLQAGFTPTDALHALGRLDLWDAEAARLGARVLAAHGRRAPDDFCRDVVEGVSRRAATALVSKVLSDECRLPDWDQEPTAAAAPGAGAGRWARERPGLFPDPAPAGRGHRRTGGSLHASGRRTATHPI